MCHLISFPWNAAIQFNYFKQTFLAQKNFLIYIEYFSCHFGSSLFLQDLILILAFHPLFSVCHTLSLITFIFVLFLCILKASLVCLPYYILYFFHTLFFSSLICSSLICSLPAILYFLNHSSFHLIIASVPITQSYVVLFLLDS